MLTQRTRCTVYESYKPCEQHSGNPLLCRFDIHHIWQIAPHERTCGVDGCDGCYCFKVRGLDAATKATAEFLYATNRPSLSVTYDSCISYNSPTSKYATIVPVRLPQGILFRGISDIVAGYAATYVLTGHQMHRLLRDTIQPRNVIAETPGDACPVAFVRMSSVSEGQSLPLGYISMREDESTLRIHLSQSSRVAEPY